MLKKFLVVVVAMLTVFLGQSQSWAAVANADKVNQEITIQNNMLVADEAPAMLAAKRMGGGGAESMMWIASIFISGLGQILMGDLWRGLKFTLFVFGVPIVWGIIAGILGVALATTGNVAIVGILGIVSMVVYLGVIAIHVWNIIDAYNMSQENAGMSKVSKEDLAKLEMDLKNAMDMAKRFNVSSNGGMNFKALAF